MPSSTSSSDAKRFALALGASFLLLVGAWESVLRGRVGATVDFAINRPETATETKPDEWLVFGNCLMMTGVSPAKLETELGPSRDRAIVNISAHEQSPIAYFEYLKRTGHYPAVVIANVSSWLNGTNFEQESALVAKSDPLGLGAAVAAPAAKDAKPAPRGGEQAYHEGDLGSGEPQKRAEAFLAGEAGKSVLTLGRRYHLFDYGLFVGTLATTADLDRSLYQLNMQTWYRVSASETDGRGFVGIRVSYGKDWSRGVEQMATRSIQRMRLSRLLTDQYWALLEAGIRDLQAHGTEVMFVRMPEHPRIKAFNDETYELPAKLGGLSQRTGVAILDLSSLGPNDGVRLFDAVHPDAEAAEVISGRIAAWLRERGFVEGSRRGRRAGGGEGP